MTDGLPPDPRIAEAFVRRPPTGDDVVLVGVVHDHPASVYRAGRLADHLDPAVLAVELPPVAVPLYEQRARSAETPPASGGEMSAAIQAAETDDVVGIDGPSAGFLLRLTASLVRTGAAPSTVRSVVRATASTVGDALRCRVAASVAAWTGRRTRVNDPVDHDCAPADDPATQAADERAHVRRAESVLSALQTDPGTEHLRRTRERHMARRLRSLGRESAGPVVAVVGVGHLDRIATALAEDQDQPA